MAATCQAFDPELPQVGSRRMQCRSIMKLYNDELQIYSDLKAKEWLEDMARRIVRDDTCV